MPTDTRVTVTIVASTDRIAGQTEEQSLYTWVCAECSLSSTFTAHDLKGALWHAASKGHTVRWFGQGEITPIAKLEEET